MPLEHITDLATRASSRFISQYRDRAKLKAIIEKVFGSEAQQLEDALWDLWAKRQVDTAEGVHLERLAKLVGMGGTGLPAADLRRIIKARVLVNRSSGTLADVRAPFEVLAPGGLVQLIEEWPAAFTLRVSGDPDFVVTNLIRSSESIRGPSGTTGWGTHGFLASITGLPAPDGSNTAVAHRRDPALGLTTWNLSQTLPQVADGGIYSLSVWGWVVPGTGTSAGFGFSLHDTPAGIHRMPGGSPAHVTLSNTPQRFSATSVATVAGNAISMFCYPFRNESATAEPNKQIALWGAQVTKGPELRRYVRNGNGAGGAPVSSPDPKLLSALLREARAAGVRSLLHWVESSDADTFTLDGAAGQALDRGRLSSVLE